MAILHCHVLKVTFIQLSSYLGVNAVTLANNHALDFGADGIRRTEAALHALNIKSSGITRGHGNKHSQVKLGIIC